MSPFRQFRHAIPAGLVALLLALVLMGTSSTTGADNYELQDMAVIAETEGISVQAAVDKYAWRDDISDINYQISLMFPNDFANSRKNEKGEAEIRFSGAVPQGARDMLADFMSANPNVVVNFIPNVGFTKAERDAAVEAVHYAVMGHSDVVTATTGFNINTMTIHTSALLVDSPPSGVLDDLKDLATSEMVDATRADILSTFSITVEEKHTAGILDAQSEHWGGETLVPTCTAGFVA